ncbi:protein-L-isoaspartate O-methyltransferase family protein [Hyphomonas sp.]|uniref:protein-L-isoaspartate O-methyltransferase family protein n=1 Tax=Hyphomonas sp. TaxID=87 RepID=UPI00391A28D0
MSAQLEARGRMMLRLREAGVTDAHVLARMETVSRADFVDAPELALLALEDGVLPIPCGQVMLRPGLVGLLLQALGLAPGSGARVLLVGAGSGYMAALLAGLAGPVIAVERYGRLVEEARGRLARLGVKGAEVHHADGLEGWLDGAPYDRILLAGQVQAVPEVLLAQLAPQGRLVAPAGPPGAAAELVTCGPEGEAARLPLFQRAPMLRPGRSQVL